ncbi:MAG: alpha/beta hydrolase [Bacteroidota bacterium]
MVNKLLLCLLFCCLSVNAMAQKDYPYPVKYLTLNIEQLPAQMAYMDVVPTRPNGQSVILFHGKNFNGYYWKDVAAFLSEKGYRVIIPDQVGWGKSDKPNIHYSFHQMAANNKALLESLGINDVIVVGHSMGGMLATRFALMYPYMVSKLVLENPIGLEDYRTFVPYTPLDEQYKKEWGATFDSYKKYMHSYFAEWKPEYDELVRQQAAPLSAPNFEKTAWANAVTYQMIYEQPVCYEFQTLEVKTLLIIGQEDRTVVGKDRLSTSQVSRYGQYPALGKKVKSQIPGAKLAELPGVGHIPHIQALQQFRQALMAFLH